MDTRDLQNALHTLIVNEGLSLSKALQLAKDVALEPPDGFKWSRTKRRSLVLVPTGERTKIRSWPNKPRMTKEQLMAHWDLNPNEVGADVIGDVLHDVWLAQKRAEELESLLSRLGIKGKLKKQLGTYQNHQVMYGEMIVREATVRGVDYPNMLKQLQRVHPGLKSDIQLLVKANTNTKKKSVWSKGKTQKSKPRVDAIALEEDEDLLRSMGIQASAREAGVLDLIMKWLSRAVSTLLERSSGRIKSLQNVLR